MFSHSSLDSDSGFPCSFLTELALIFFIHFFLSALYIQAGPAESKLSFQMMPWLQQLNQYNSISSYETNIHAEHKTFNDYSIIKSTLYTLNFIKGFWHVHFSITTCTHSCYFFLLVILQGDNREVVAVKVVAKKSLNKASTENLLTEIEILKTVRHPHIVQLKDFQVWSFSSFKLVPAYARNVL